jgi:proteasome lid subunit RPN8/RPN11
LERKLIKLEPAVIELIKTEGENVYPNECCGILLGAEGNDGRIVSRISPVINTGKEGELYHRFRIEPEEVMKAELYALKNSLEVLGFYHSHPDCPALPSEYDREHALPFYSYVIASVYKGKAKDVTSWRLSDDRAEFIKEL